MSKIKSGSVEKWKQKQRNFHCTVHRMDTETQVNHIIHIIFLGSRVLSDERKTYLELKKERYNHKLMNNLILFMDTNGNTAHI